MFAVIHISEFSLHAVLRATPGLVSAQPVAVLADDTTASARSRALLLAANLPARALGITAGLTASQALARCAALRLLSASLAAEAEARATLLATAFTLSPLVEATAPGTATADVTGLAAAERLPALHRAVATLAALALPTTAGLATTPLLALYAAHHAARAPSLSHSLSREARDPVVVITDARAFLDPLPLATAAPPPALAQILAGWGVHTLGALTDLPRADITLRLGAAGAALWARAAGETTRPLHPVSPPREFSGAFAFEDAVETLEPLLFILRRLIDRLTLELTAAGFVAEELSLALTLADESTHTRTFRLPTPSAAPDLLFRALHTHLESLNTPSPIAALHLHVTPVRPLVRQHGLFDSSLRDPHGFSESLARAVAVVGSDRVGTPQLTDTHRPDAFALSPPASVIPPAAPPPLHAALGLPLRRFRPPLPTNVELVGHAPAFVWCDYAHGPVASTRGPWRGSGEWWETGRSWEREEWDVALADGCGLYRLLRTPTGWFIEGEYD